MEKSYVVLSLRKIILRFNGVGATESFVIPREYQKEIKRYSDFYEDYDAEDYAHTEGFCVNDDSSQDFVVFDEEAPPVSVLFVDVGVGNTITKMV